MHGMANRGKIQHGKEPAYLVLDEELDALNGSGGGLRDGGRDTAHCDDGVSTIFRGQQPTAAQPFSRTAMVVRAVRRRCNLGLTYSGSRPRRAITQS